MFGPAYFGETYFGSTYFGPADFTQLNTPTNLLVTSVSATSVSFSWTDTNTLPAESSFELQLSIESNFLSPIVISISANATTRTVTGITPNTTYYARLRAVGNGSSTTNSNWTATLNFTTLPSGLQRDDTWYIVLEN